MDPIDCPETSVTTNLRQVKYQKSADLRRIKLKSLRHIPLNRLILHVLSGPHPELFTGARGCPWDYVILAFDLKKTVLQKSWHEYNCNITFFATACMYVSTNTKHSMFHSPNLSHKVPLFFLISSKIFQVF